MHRNRSVRLRVALTGACLLPACTTADIDETDHGAFFADARVRKRLDATDDHAGPYAAVGWTSAHGNPDALDYTISTVTLGAGMELPAWEQVGFSIDGGLLWQFNDLTTTMGSLDEENGFGIYVALDAGWHATPWLEPCVRVVGTQTVDEFTSSEQIEVGARLHFIEHAALFLGWRHTHYEIDDFDLQFNISSVELDASGMVVGLVVSF